MLSILQLSDIHFVDDVDLDIDADLRDAVIRFAPEIHRRFGDIDVIAVCGDVAYSGKKEEYARASSFLRNVETAVGRPRIFVIPGNHDIYMPATENADQTVWRGRPRQESLSHAERDRELVELLKDDVTGAGLLAPLEEYRNFAAEFKCDFRATRPFWESDVLPIAPEVGARFRGLNSVLVSNQLDKRDRLILGRLQTASLTNDPGIVNITLCHHPYEWLLDGEDRRNSVDHRSVLHVTGHVHRQDSRPTPCGVHLLAGALQPDRREDEWESRLNVITVEVEGADPRLAIEIHSAKWQASIDGFAFDPAHGSFQGQIQHPTGAIPSTPIDAEMARLQRRLALLSSGDRFAAARRIELDLPPLARLPASEIPAAIMMSARNSDKLPELWREVERLHGNQTDRSNPFT